MRFLRVRLATRTCINTRRLTWALWRRLPQLYSKRWALIKSPKQTSQRTKNKRETTWSVYQLEEIRTTLWSARWHIIQFRNLLLLIKVAATWGRAVCLNVCRWIRTIAKTKSVIRHVIHHLNQYLINVLIKIIHLLNRAQFFTHYHYTKTFFASTHFHRTFYIIFFLNSIFFQHQQRLECGVETQYSVLNTRTLNLWPYLRPDP